MGRFTWLDERFWAPEPPLETPVVEPVEPVEPRDEVVDSEDDNDDVVDESELELLLSNWKIELWWDCSCGCCCCCCSCCCCWQPGSNLCEPMELPSRTANMVI